MNRRLGALACALLIAVAATTTGCGLGEDPSSCPGAGQQPEGLESRDLVGTYRGTGGAALELRRDGSFTSFTATGWPRDIDEGNISPSRTTSSGRWKLKPAGGTGWPVALYFDHTGEDPDGTDSDGFAAGVLVSGDRQKPRLYNFIGDPDMCDVHSFTMTG